MRKWKKNWMILLSVKGLEVIRLLIEAGAIIDFKEKDIPPNFNQQLNPLRRFGTHQEGKIISFHSK